MNREKRYLFKMMLTPEQNKLIEDTVSECLGIHNGEKILASLQPGDGSLLAMIVPPGETRAIDVALNAMRERTELDNLGLIG